MNDHCKTKCQANIMLLSKIMSKQTKWLIVWALSHVLSVADGFKSNI